MLNHDIRGNIAAGRLTLIQHYAIKRQSSGLDTCRRATIRITRGFTPRHQHAAMRSATRNDPLSRERSERRDEVRHWVQARVRFPVAVSPHAQVHFFGYYAGGGSGTKSLGVRFCDKLVVVERPVSRSRGKSREKNDAWLHVQRLLQLARSCSSAICVTQPSPVPRGGEAFEALASQIEL